MRKKKRKIHEDQVARYWETHDASEELDWSPEKKVNFIYQPPVKSISIRLPEPLLTELKRIAARMDVAYQALIKMLLSEKVKELRRA